jgi:hypothetical protein
MGITTLKRYHQTTNDDVVKNTVKQKKVEVINNIVEPINNIDLNKTKVLDNKKIKKKSIKSKVEVG